MATKKINLPDLYPKQRRAVFNDSRYNLIEASTKAGKTVSCLVWQAYQVLNDPDSMNHWWVAPVSQQADIAFRRAKKMLPDSEWEQNKTKSVLTFENGARWTFKTGKDSDNLFGEDVVSAIIDEASRLPAESWHAVRSTLTATKGPIRMIGNVKGRKNWFYRLCRKAEQGDMSDADYFKLTAWDAVEGGVLDREEIEDAKETLPEHVFNELYLAEPGDDGGNPFGTSAIDGCAIEHPSGKEPVVWGWDLAKSKDYTVGIPLDEDMNVTEDWCRFQAPWKTTIDRINAKTDGLPGFVDSTGVGDPILEDLGTQMEGYKFTQASKQQLMEGLAVSIQKEAVHFPVSKITDELYEFEYKYRRNGSVIYTAPSGLHDDCVCALALAVQKYKQLFAEASVGWSCA